MKAKLTALAILPAILVPALAAQAGESKGPAAGVPELEALDHYIGDWDSRFSFGKGSGGDEEFTGRVTAKWSLDGHFVDQEGIVRDQDGKVILTIRTLTTYDKATKAYRSWTFSSSGTTSLSRGTWNAKTRTMTSTTRDRSANTKTVIKANFSEPGKERWSITTTNEAGETISVIKGRNVLRKAD